MIISGNTTITPKDNKFTVISNFIFNDKKYSDEEINEKIKELTQKYEKEASNSKFLESVKTKINFEKKKITLIAFWKMSEDMTKKIENKKEENSSINVNIDTYTGNIAFPKVGKEELQDVSVVKVLGEKPFIKATEKGLEVVGTLVKYTNKDAEEKLLLSLSSPAVKKEKKLQKLQNALETLGIKSTIEEYQGKFRVKAPLFVNAFGDKKEELLQKLSEEKLFVAFKLSKNVLNRSLTDDNLTVLASSPISEEQQNNTEVDKEKVKSKKEKKAKKKKKRELPTF